MTTTMEALGNLPWDKFLFISGLVIVLRGYFNYFLISIGIFFSVTGLFIAIIQDYRQDYQNLTAKEQQENHYSISPFVIIYLVIVALIIGISVYVLY